MRDINSKIKGNAWPEQPKLITKHSWDFHTTVVQSKGCLGWNGECLCYQPSPKLLK